MNCWNNLSGYSDYCLVHLKMFKEKGTEILLKITSKIGKNWTSFIQRVTSETEKDDSNLIQFIKFVRILEDYHINLS